MTAMFTTDMPQPGGPIAISLDSAQVSWRLSGTDQPVLCDMAPSALLPRLQEEPLRADIHRPCHLRASGAPWPPEAMEVGNRLGGRYPLAIAWNDLVTAEVPTDQSSSVSHWTYQGRRIEPSEAIAAALAATLPRIAATGEPTPSEILLPIPDCLQEVGRRKLLSACGAYGRVRLVWRPIAAAAVWCEYQQEELLQHPAIKKAPRRQDIVEIELGDLLTVYCGHDHLEVTLLAVVARRKGGQWSILPGRRRPVPANFRINPALYDLLDQISTADAEATSAWHDLWGGGNPVNAAPHLLAGYRSAIQSLVRANVDQVEQLLGAIFLGSFAPQILSSCQRLLPGTVKGCTMWEEPGEAIVTHGASLIASAIAIGRTPYLDTLPRVRTIAYRQGEPQWVHLLQEDDRWAEGGQTWRRTPPMSGFHIARGEDHVSLTLAHEEFTTVRKVAADLPEEANDVIPFAFDVRIEPAQGGARVEVLPEDPSAFDNRNILLDWERMEDLGISPEQHLEDQPRLFPPADPRGASWYIWQDMPLVEKLLGEAAADLSPRTRKAPTNLEVLTACLQKKESQLQFGPMTPTAFWATAFDSGGRPPEEISAEYGPIIADLEDALVSHVLSGHRHTSLALKCLRYMSSKHPDLQDYLWQRLRSEGTETDREVLDAFSWTTNRPAMLHDLAEIAAVRIRKQGLNLNWIRAFSRPLRWHGNASNEIELPVAEYVVKAMLRTFEKQLKQGNAAHLFREAAVTIVFLLRCRTRQEDFLDPADPLGQSIKSAFAQAYFECVGMDPHSDEGWEMRKRFPEEDRDAEYNRLDPMGGAVDIPGTLKQLIDYIDKRGKGAIRFSDD